MGQLALKGIKVQVLRAVEGLDLGVLSDGRACMSGRALSRLCGIKNSSISEATTDWAANAPGKRVTKLAQWLETKGDLDAEALGVETTKPGVAGNFMKAYPEDVCIRILEYYAFEAPNPTEEAKHNFRLLGRAGVRAFVYHHLGFDPRNVVPDIWRDFHERILLDTTPPGFFSVLKESTDLVVAAIRAGLPYDAHVVPDISVGQLWATYWNANGLAAKYGDRTKHPHNFPDHYPQAKSNPQPINIYPVEALGEFRAWMQREYIPQRFPAYLKGKVKDGALPPSIANLLMQNVSPAPEAELATSRLAATLANGVIGGAILPASRRSRPCRREGRTSRTGPAASADSFVPPRCSGSSSRGRF